MYECTFIFRQVYIYIHIYMRLLLSSCWLLLVDRLTPVPPIPMPRGQDFSLQGARTIQVYLYTYTSRRRSSPGKRCVGSALAICVLDHPWETMSWITPGKLCVASAFGNCVLPALVLSFWVPSLGSQLWSPALGPSVGPTGPMAHWAHGPHQPSGLLASPLGNIQLYMA